MTLFIVQFLIRIVLLLHVGFAPVRNKTLGKPRKRNKMTRYGLDLYESEWRPVAGTRAHRNKIKILLNLG